MPVDPQEPESYQDTFETAAISFETSEADDQEQRTDLIVLGDSPIKPPTDVSSNVADAMDQARTVGLGPDEYEDDYADYADYAPSPDQEAW